VAAHDPSNAAYRLVGIKFFDTAKGPVPQLAFRSAGGKLVTLFMEPWPIKKDAPFREVAAQDGVVTLVWVDQKIGCAVSGNLPPSQLANVARSLFAGLIG